MLDDNEAEARFREVCYRIVAQLELEELMFLFAAEVRDEVEKKEKERGSVDP
jgi:hypothetical protein